MLHKEDLNRLYHIWAAAREAVSCARSIIASNTFLRIEIIASESSVKPGVIAFIGIVDTGLPWYQHFTPPITRESGREEHRE